MNNKLEQKFINILKKYCNEKIIENISLIDISDNKKLIEQGVLFDDGHTCYHDYEKLEDVIIGLVTSADNYGIYLGSEFIGIVSIFNKYYKDLTRLEISICIKNEYRNKNIGKYCLETTIHNYFKNQKNKSIHLSIREDNIKSRKIAENCGFKLYTGYKCDNIFTDQTGNIIPQVQYLLKRKDYIKK